MTVTGYGFDGTMAENFWSELHKLIADQIVEGYAVSAATGTRLVSVASGSLVAAGVLVKNTAAFVPAAMDANAGSTSRIDTVVATISWAGVGGTTTIGLVKGTAGTNPTPPTLTQTSGVTWQVPLAHVTVVPSATQLVAANIADARPTRRRELVYDLVVDPMNVASTSAPISLASLKVPNPGWEDGYRVAVIGQVSFESTTTGRANVAVKVDGATVQSHRNHTDNQGLVILNGSRSGVKTAASNVQVLANPTLMSAGDRLITGAGYHFLQVIVTPA